MGDWPRIVLMCAVATTIAGCFQPLYGEHSVTGGPGLSQALGAVDILQIDAATGTNDARIAVELRNDLLFGLQGGGGGGSPTHSLKILVTPSRYVASQDIQTGLSSSNIYSLTATYQLTDLRTGKVVLTDKAYAPVSYDIPGEQQRFASTRALRDSENRAALLVADSIRTRLASYFVSGS
jgi:LPS-assembly lipoprotein